MLQNDEPSRGKTGGDLLVFIGIAAAAFFAVHSLGLFSTRSSDLTPLERLRRLPHAIASRVADDLGFLRRWGLAPSVDAAPPHRTERSYRVRGGDTLSLIAKRHEVELVKLVDHNRLANPDRLEVGQLLTIPRRWEAKSAPRAESPAQRAVEELIVMAEGELRAARFDEALHSTKASERLLQAASADDPVAALQRSRLEIVRATVHSAFGNDEEAKRSLERALDANPELALDPASSPRKVLRALEATKAERRPPTG